MNTSHYYLSGIASDLRESQSRGGGRKAKGIVRTKRRSYTTERRCFSVHPAHSYGPETVLGLSYRDDKGSHSQGSNVYIRSLKKEEALMFHPISTQFLRFREKKKQALLGYFLSALHIRSDTR